MIGNPQIDFKIIDANTIKVIAEEITDEHIWKLESIKKRLDTYDIREMSWYEYDYEPYYSWGDRTVINPTKRQYKDYGELLDNLIKKSQDDRRRGWTNRINFLNIILKLEDKATLEKSELDKKLDFIVNMLFKIRCYVDVHHNELLARELAEAESLGFNIEPSKT